MKVVIIITGLNTGGAEMMLIKLLEHLDRERFAPHVISLTTLGALASRIAALDIPVEAMGMKPGLLSLVGFFWLVQRLKILNPDVVNTWMYHADLLGGLAARLAGISAIGWCIRNSNLDKNLTKFSTRAIVSLCALISKWVPSRILSCSEKARQVHEEYGYAAVKMLVVPNGFDLTRFKPDYEARESIRNELRVETDTPLLGLIGRFDPQKNHAMFFEAAGLLHRHMPQVHFVLAGQGIDMGNAALRRAISQADVTANTHLLGLRHDMPALMATLDVLACSSSYGEAFPNVLGEAMACGVPCVVTDVGDSAYIVGDTGRIVYPGDVAGMATAMKSVLSMSATERRSLGAQARARVSKNFEIVQVAKRYEVFYEGLATRAEKMRGA